MRLLLLHPEIATRDCGHCQAFQYDETTGRPVERVKDSGEYFPRYSPLPCRTLKGCLKGTPENPKTLSERNDAAYRHYRQCRAVGRHPEDPISDRNAGLIRAVEDSVDRERQLEFQRMLIEVVAKR